MSQSYILTVFIGIQELPFWSSLKSWHPLVLAPKMSGTSEEDAAIDISDVVLKSSDKEIVPGSKAQNKDQY